jgi:hypothetical protein
MAEIEGVISHDGKIGVAKRPPPASSIRVNFVKAPRGIAI